jgi:hypothetical protein
MLMIICMIAGQSTFSNLVDKAPYSICVSDTTNTLLSHGESGLSLVTFNNVILINLLRSPFRYS